MRTPPSLALTRSTNSCKAVCKDSGNIPIEVIISINEKWFNDINEREGKEMKRK